jgi:hypothetical protein
MSEPGQLPKHLLVCVGNGACGRGRPATTDRATTRPLVSRHATDCRLASLLARLDRLALQRGHD